MPKAKKFVPGGQPKLDQPVHVAQAADQIPHVDLVKNKSTAQKILEAEREGVMQRKLMNMSKVLLPIMRAVINNPGTLASAEDKAKAIREMVNACMSGAERMLKTAAPTLANEPWAKSNAFLVCANIIAAEWGKTGDLRISVDTFAADDFFSDIAKSLADMDDRTGAWLEGACNTPPVRSESEAISSIRMSLLKGFAPLYTEVSAFPFWRNHLPDGAKAVEELADGLMQKLSIVAADHANTVADHLDMNSNTRVMFWQGVISRTFTMARDEYKVLAQRAQDEVAILDTAAKRGAVRREWANRDVGAEVAALVGHSVEVLSRIADSVIDDFDGKYSIAKKMGNAPK